MPVVSGMDESRLLNINKWIERWIDENKLPGASIQIVRKGKLVHESYHGFQDLTNKIPLTKNKNTIFRIYSMTKPIVSIALMILYERGLFKLKDPVSLYIPSFDKRKLCGIYDYDQNNKLFGKNKKNLNINSIKTKLIKSQIRIWQLLTHTSGLSYGFDRYGIIEPVDKLYHDNGCNLTKRDNLTLQEWIDQRLTKMPLLFEPGTRWNYSYASDVCGRLIEVLSGQRLDIFLKENIFTPLSMNDTSFFVHKDKMDRFAKVYMSSLSQATFKPDPSKSKKKKNIEDKLIDISHTVAHNYDGSKKFLSGGGGLVSTLDDYMSFCKMLLNGGKTENGVNIISPKTLEFMTMNHLPGDSDLISLTTDGYKELSQPGIGFGLGFSVILNDVDKGLNGRRVSDGSGQLSSVGSFAWGGAAETFFWIDPKEELCVVFMTQLLYNDRLRFDIRSKLQTLVYSAIVDDVKERRRIKSKM